MVRNAMSGLMLLLACALLLASCGGSAVPRDPVQEARVVAETNALCRRSAALPPAARRSKQQMRATQETFGALSRALGKAAAYLPAGKDLNETRRARHALFAEESRHATGEPTGPDLRFEKLQLRIYRDEIALGLTCDGQVALAARQTEREFTEASHPERLVIH
jgi:hypothetical protein